MPCALVQRHKESSLHTRPAIRWHPFAFVVAFMLLVALGWQGKRTQEAVLQTNQAVSQSLETITAIQAIRSALQDIETGTRGFVITADEAYLDAYASGLIELEAHRRQLQEFADARGYPQQRWFEQFDSTAAERLTIAASNIRVRRESGLAVAATHLHQAGGKQLMDRLRELLDDVENRERQQLFDANRAVRETIAHSRRVALIGSLLVAALFFAALWAVRRNLATRQALARQAQAGEARLDALLQTIPDQLYAIDARQQVSSLSQPRSIRGPAPQAIEPLLLDLLAQPDTDYPRQNIWCEVASRRMFEVRLLPTGLGDHLAIARDITELQRNRDSLQQQQAFLRKVVDTDENLIFVRDAHGRFLLCNTAFAALLDCQPQHIEQRRLDELPGAQRLLPLLQGESELLAGGELRSSDVSLIDACGQERWLQLVKRPLRLSPSICHVVTVAVDISLRRRMEQMKTEFISTVSHELRTPLTAIRGALGMLASGFVAPGTAEAQPLLEIAHKNSERLVRLINDILDIEKLEAGRLTFDLQLCDVRALVAQALHDIEPYARSFDVHLQQVPPDAAARVEANLDPDRFAQIMANLLSNAIKHSPAGGCVSVDLRSGDNGLELGVQDQGPGIPESFRGRIFERFAQADASDARRRGGTGLGLAITRSLVEQMHGSIGFDSQEGRGTRFWLRLPLATASAPALAPPAAAGQSRILIVEPDCAAAARLAETLHEQGYATLLAATALDARELLAEYRVQALTLSPALADEDVGAFLQSLRSQPAYRHLPVLIVGLQPQRRDEDDGQLRGGAVRVIDWLPKPVDPARLLDVVNACLTEHPARPRILHVEDDQDLRLLLARQIEPLDIELQGAASLAEARRLLGAQSYQLAIVDLMLPDGDGSELFDQLAQAVPPPPVIIFSALDAPVHDSRLVLRQLVKSRHDGRELGALIQHLLHHRTPATEADEDDA